MVHTSIKSKRPPFAIKHKFSSMSLSLAAALFTVYSHEGGLAARHPGIHGHTRHLDDSLRQRSTFNVSGSIEGTGSGVEAAVAEDDAAVDFALTFAFALAFAFGSGMGPSFINPGVVGVFSAVASLRSGTCSGSPEVLRHVWERPPRQLQPWMVRWSSRQQLRALIFVGS